MAAAAGGKAEQMIQEQDIREAREGVEELSMVAGTQEVRRRQAKAMLVVPGMAAHGPLKEGVGEELEPQVVMVRPRPDRAEVAEMEPHQLSLAHRYIMLVAVAVALM